MKKKDKINIRIGKVRPGDKLFIDDVIDASDVMVMGLQMEIADNHPIMFRQMLTREHDRVYRLGDYGPKEYIVKAAMENFYGVKK